MWKNKNRSESVQITFKLRSKAIDLYKKYVKIAQKKGGPKGVIFAHQGFLWNLWVFLQQETCIGWSRYSYN